MLSPKEVLCPVFYNPSGDPKPIDCVRVDGATDEGPSHEEVQTAWHLEHKKAVTLVTARTSGSSYMNHVELQNGCLSLGHANTFLPLTSGGSRIDPDSGKVNGAKLMDLAIDAYISRVSGAPCGSTVIQLFKGPKESSHVTSRDDLLIFLKGTKRDKERLKLTCPSLYSFLQKVWDVRSRHMVKGLSCRYFFMLICCYQDTCPHPLCAAGRHPQLTWYDGGPSVYTLPLPVIDEQRTWGRLQECGTCGQF